MSNIHGAVLLSPIEPVPFWLSTHTLIDECVRAYESNVHKLYETGHKQVYEYDEESKLKSLRNSNPDDFFEFPSSKANPDDRSEALKACPVIKATNYDFRYAWLSPSGKFYPCRQFDHYLCATNIVYVEYEPNGIFDSEEFLEKAGWFKLTDAYNSRTPAIYGHHLSSLNSNQVNALYEWCSYNNHDFDSLIKNHC